MVLVAYVNHSSRLPSMNHETINVVLMAFHQWVLQQVELTPSNLST